MKPRRQILCGISFNWKKEQLQLDLPTSVWSHFYCSNAKGAHGNQMTSFALALQSRIHFHGGEIKGAKCFK